MHFPTEIFRLIKEYLFVNYDEMRDLFGSLCTNIMDCELYEAKNMKSLKRNKILSVSKRNSNYFKYLSYSKLMETHRMIKKSR
jgi:hypothetical protein